MVNMYWNTNPASVTTNKPNTQVKPNRGERMMHALKLFLNKTKHYEKFQRNTRPISKGFFISTQQYKLLINFTQKRSDNKAISTQKPAKYFLCICKRIYYYPKK